MSTDIIIGIVFFAIGFLGGMKAGHDSVFSPLGMLVATLACVWMIAPMFMVEDLYGWLMIGFSIFYLRITIRAYVLYNRFKD